MSWPDEQTLRAILELPGVSGETRHDIERYLADSRLHEIEAEREQCQGKVGVTEWTRTGAATKLRRSLNSAVQAHWSQLVEAGKI